MSKADKDGWIRHRGGKCPVGEDVVVEIRTRAGEYEVCAASGFAWDAEGEDQIMAYRLHKPAEQPQIKLESGAEISYSPGEPLVSIAPAINPIEWRDRIHEIDRTIEALEEERVSLIQRLADEGLQLLQSKACGEVQPAEDMSDWAKWREGDIIEFIRTDGDTSHFTLGKHYVVADVDMRSCNPVNVKEDDGGDYNGWRGEYFKFVSRPAS